MSMTTNSINRTCIGCKEIMPSRGELYRHYYVCEEHLNMFKGSPYEKRVREAYKRYNGDLKVLSTVCLGCYEHFPSRDNFYEHYRDCNEAKKVVKRPVGKEITRNKAVENTLKTCQACETTFASRNDLHRHYAICERNLEQYKGTDYYDQMKRLWDFCENDTHTIQTTCPGCYEKFKNHGELSRHRFVCDIWLTPSKAKQLLPDSAEYVKEKPIEKKVENSEKRIKEAPKSILKKTTIDPTPQIKEIPPEEPMSPKEEVVQESTQDNNLYVPIQIQEIFIEIHGKPYYVPMQVVKAVAYPVIEKTTTP